MREWLADIQHSFERFDLWLDDVRDLGDAVLALGGIELRARGSGLDMKEPMGWAFEIRDGRVARMRFYAEPSEALEAVGLREWPTTFPPGRLARRLPLAEPRSNHSCAYQGQRGPGGCFAWKAVAREQTSVGGGGGCGPVFRVRRP